MPHNHVTLLSMRCCSLLLRGKRSISTIVPPRRGTYAKVNDADIVYFERFLGKENVITKDIDEYNIDWMKWFKGSSSCVLLPKSADDISQILRYCFTRRLAVVPQSGNTGLVGGSIPVYDEIVLSLRKLNKHYHFEPQSGVVECDAGIVLEDLDNRLASEGYMVPLDLGAKGSCFIGGNISTAAGGLRMIRFGSLHNHVLGLQVVLPDDKGTIVKFGSGLKKDNTNLHMHHLFIGAEGQLGVVTRIWMNVVPRLPSTQVAMLGVSSFEKCREIVRLSRSRLGEVLSALELIDANSMQCVLEDNSFHPVLRSNPAFYILVETIGSDERHDKEKVAKFLDEAMERGLLVDGVQALSREEASYMWRVRETVPVALARSGYVFKHDVCLPLQHFYTLTEVVKHRLGLEGLEARVFTFGHIGDGNSHLNIVTKGYSPDVADELYPFIYDWVVINGGSISAEHGIGQLKRPFMAFGKGHEIEIAKRLKEVFDPRRILSPYKML
uniref:D-2-hydroxyglutarate dehydrogenase, mitochondrial n=1 Tax=Parascaris univalens TaxID=6257 RepID=A0A914ZHZ0_PARUN